MSKDNKKARVRIIGSMENADLISQLVKRFKSLSRTIPEMSYHWLGQGAAGSDQSEDIEQGVKSANIFLFMVSQDLLDDDAAYEMVTLAMRERDSRQDVRVIPIILSACQWQREMFKGLVSLPRDTKPVDQANNKNAVWTTIVEELTTIIEAYIAGASK